MEGLAAANGQLSQKRAEALLQALSTCGEGAIGRGSLSGGWLALRTKFKIKQTKKTFLLYLPDLDPAAFISLVGSEYKV